VVEVADLGISSMEPRDLPFDVAVNVARDTKSGIVCRHPCGGGDEPIKGVYSGYRPYAVGYRLHGANCLFTLGIVNTVSDESSPITMRELLTARHTGLTGIDCDTGIGLHITEQGTPTLQPTAPWRAPRFERKPPLACFETQKVAA
jgi:hypothetical protein